MYQEEFKKVLIEKFPLCIATEQPICNEMVETDLETSMSINEKVEAKLRVGIEPTIYEEQMCTLPYDLPNEIWKPVPNTFDKYLISNKRRIKGPMKIVSLGRRGSYVAYVKGKTIRLNPNVFVINNFNVGEVRFNDTKQITINKLLCGEKITPEEIMKVTVKLPGEIWRPISGFEKLYAVSNIGRVMNLLRKSIVLQALNKVGYCQVMLCKSPNIRQNALVHRLVANEFIPKTEEDIRLNRIYVNHKNGIKIDNRVENLEWCTCSENVLHAIDTNLFPIRKMTHSLLEHAVELYESGLRITDILKLPEFSDISEGALYQALFRQTNKCFKDIRIPKMRGRNK